MLGVRVQKKLHLSSSNFCAQNSCRHHVHTWRKHRLIAVTLCIVSNDLPCAFVSINCLWTAWRQIPNRRSVFYRRYSVFFGIVNTDVDIGIEKYSILVRFLPERDYVTFGSLLSQFRLSSICRLSVCLSSVTLVHPTQEVEAFGNISSPLCTLAIL